MDRLSRLGINGGLYMPRRTYARRKAVHQSNLCARYINGKHVLSFVPMALPQQQDINPVVSNTQLDQDIEEVPLSPPILLTDNEDGEKCHQAVQQPKRKREDIQHSQYQTKTVSPTTPQPGPSRTTKRKRESKNKREGKVQKNIDNATYTPTKTDDLLLTLNLIMLLPITIGVQHLQALEEVLVTFLESKEDADYLAAMSIPTHLVNQFRTLVTDIYATLTHMQLDPSLCEMSLKQYVASSKGITLSLKHVDSQLTTPIMTLFNTLRAENPMLLPLSNIAAVTCSSLLSTTSLIRTTSTPSTSAPGVTAVAGAITSAPSVQTIRSSSDGPTTLPNWQTKPSSLSSSITFREGNQMFTARSAAPWGDTVLKMELYNTTEIRHTNAQDWWKHAFHKSKVCLQSDHPVMKKAKELQALLENSLTRPPFSS